MALPYELHARTDKISMCLPLAADPEQVWEDLRHKTRNRVRKAQGAGLTVVSGGLELLDDFYRMWTVRMHELGTPCYPRKLFASIMETFPDMATIFLARLHERHDGGPVRLRLRGLGAKLLGAALREYDEIGPNYILNWAAIEHYCHAGMKWFDFGRSTVGSGQHTFKERWAPVRSACAGSTGRRTAGNPRWPGRTTRNTAGKWSCGRECRSGRAACSVLSSVRPCRNGPRRRGNAQHRNSCLHAPKIKALGPGPWIPCDVRHGGS